MQKYDRKGMVIIDRWTYTPCKNTIGKAWLLLTDVRRSDSISTVVETKVEIKKEVSDAGNNKNYAQRNPP
jgi:hypothetical protein